MNTASETRLKAVNPILASKVRVAIATLAKQGFQVEVVQGLRTYAEQDALYAKGRTKPGPKVTNARGGYSNHNFGLACDLAPFANNKPDWNNVRAFTAIGSAAKKEGLLWGGDWKKLVDRPHVELPGPSLAECRLLFQQGGLKKVWAAVKPRGLV